MNAAYLPKTLKGKLARLAEEAGEVVTAYGKIQRFGLDTRYNPVLKRVTNRDYAVESNREAMMRELRDLESALNEARAALHKAPIDLTNPHADEG